MTRTRQTAVTIPAADITLAKKSRSRKALPILAKPTETDDHSIKSEALPDPCVAPLTPPSMATGSAAAAETNIDIAQAPVASARSKQVILIELLKREGGAGLEDMKTATGWQKHSLRGFISGTLKKKLSLTVTSLVEPVSGGRIYRIVDEPPPLAEVAEVSPPVIAHTVLA